MTISATIKNGYRQNGVTVSTEGDKKGVEHCVEGGRLWLVGKR